MLGLQYAGLAIRHWTQWLPAKAEELALARLLHLSVNRSRWAH